MKTDYSYLKGVALKLARQDQPTTKWLTKKQTAWLEGCCQAAKIYGRRTSLHGSAPQGRSRAYNGPNFSLTISPINQCGIFCYYGSDEYMAGHRKRLEEKLKAELEEAKKKMYEAGEAWIEWKNSDKSKLTKEQIDSLDPIMQKIVDDSLRKVDSIQGQLKSI